MGRLSGDLESGMRGTPVSGSGDGSLTNADVYRRLRDAFGMLPFAYLGSNVDGDDPRWLSYMIGAVISTDDSKEEEGSPYWQAIQASVAERAFLGLHRRLTGRYPFYLEHAPGRFRIQLAANALTGGSFRRNVALLARSSQRGTTLRTKRLLFQCPANLNQDGTVVHCAHCPDAVVRHGRLVPVCISDQFGETAAE